MLLSQYDFSSSDKSTMVEAKGAGLLDNVVAVERVPDLNANIILTNCLTDFIMMTLKIKMNSLERENMLR